TTPPLPDSPSVFGQIKRLKHLPRLRSLIVEFEPQNLLTDSDFNPNSASDASSSADNINSSPATERFIVQIKSLLCGACARTETRFHSIYTAVMTAFSMHCHIARSFVLPRLCHTVH